MSINPHAERDLVEIINPSTGETKILDRTTAGDWVRVHGWRFLRTSGVTE